MQTQTTKYNVGCYVSKLMKRIDIFIHFESTKFCLKWKSWEILYTMPKCI
jgi:hypothetical protein